MKKNKNKNKNKNGSNASTTCPSRSSQRKDTWDTDLDLLPEPDQEACPNKRENRADSIQDYKDRGVKQSEYASRAIPLCHLPGRHTGKGDYAARDEDENRADDGHQETNA